ncbi:MAG TPA: glycosyltransferase, partial [Candidatus Eisenbacteria bacterium]|nr:glycosyltransferase [Candidatus Eisenbacteria bacterium]
HLDSERTWRGGERQVLELMRRQREMGDEAHLAAPTGSEIATRAAAEGIPIHPVAMRGTWDLGSAVRVANLHRSIRPHVVHWHAARAHAIGAMAALLAPGPARVLSRRVDFPVRRSPGSRLLYALPIDAILAISEGVRHALVASGVADAAIRVVPSGIDLAPHAVPRDRGAIRAREGVREDEILVLQVAALAPHKSQHDLLRAARVALHEEPRLVFWIAGEGALRGELERMHEALALGDRVRFLGFREDILDLLAAADLFCVSSYLEGMGTATLDPMAAGLAVVATRVGGIPEIVEEGVTGVLVEPRDPEALAGAILTLAGDPVRRERMGAEARIKVRDFSADRTAERTRRAYEEALARLTQ